MEYKPTELKGTDEEISLSAEIRAQYIKDTDPLNIGRYPSLYDTPIYVQQGWINIIRKCREGYVKLDSNENR